MSEWRGTVNEMSFEVDVVALLFGSSVEGIVCASHQAVCKVGHVCCEHYMHEAATGCVGADGCILGRVFDPAEVQCSCEAVAYKQAKECGALHVCAQSVDTESRLTASRFCYSKTMPRGALPCLLWRQDQPLWGMRPSATGWRHWGWNPRRARGCLRIGVSKRPPGGSLGRRGLP